MNEVIIKEFPCSKLGYCPYGVLVEEFPLLKDEDDESCPIFQHQCPVYYVAEPVSVERDYGESSFA